MTTARNKDRPVDDILSEVEDRVRKGGYNFDKCATVVNRHEPMEKMDVVASLIRCEGNYSSMAKLLFRRRAAVQAFVETRRDMVVLREEFIEEKLDTIEENLLDEAVNGDVALGKFLMTTRGKNRGYSTRHEATGKDGDPLVPQVNAKETLGELLEKIGEVDESIKRREDSKIAP